MEFGKRFDRPKDLERLDRGDRIARLHHQLGLMYDRVFLTGDWEGERPEQIENKGLRENIETNVFEDIANRTDAHILAEDLSEFLSAALEVRRENSNTPLGLKKEMRDRARSQFLVIITLVRDILRQSAKDINTTEEIEMEKCIDDNIHHFRDMAINPIEQRGKGGLRQISIEEDEEQVRKGFETILAGLRDIFVKRHIA